MKETIYSTFPCKFVLLLHPLERLSLFLSKFVLLGQKYSLKEWLNPHWITSGLNLTVRIYIGPMGRDHSHRDWYKYSAGLN